MAKKSLQRNYNMSDAELAIFTNNLIISMTRDLAEFTDYGVDAAAITSLRSKQNDFDSFPQDVSLRADVSIAVEAKDAAGEALILAIKNIANRAAYKWGEDSSFCKKFDASNLSKKNEIQLLYAGRNAHDVGEELLLDMADVGLTQAMLDDLSAKSQDFEDKMGDVTSKRQIRDDKTEERIILGNELYELDAKYCDLGKRIFADVSESKYNDYVIYKKTTDLPSKVQNLNYDQLNTKLKWDIAAGADEYELQEKMGAIGFDWVAIYSGEENEFIHTPPAPGEWLYRCRAKNTNGDGAWSEELTVIKV